MFPRFYLSLHLIKSFKRQFTKKARLRKLKQPLYKTADLVTFTEEILNGKLHFLCSEQYLIESNLIQ